MKTTKTTQISYQIRQTVVSAVYVNLQSKSARANDIASLPKFDDTYDKHTVIESIGNEFNIMSTIWHCRRLGVGTTNRPKNLLATLESIDHVVRMRFRAKQLRSSILFLKM